MKASELIKKLQEEIEIYGDYDAYISMFNYDLDCFEFQDVTTVRYDECFNGETKMIVVG